MGMNRSVGGWRLTCLGASRVVGKNELRISALDDTVSSAKTRRVCINGVIGNIATFCFAYFKFLVHERPRRVHMKYMHDKNKGGSSHVGQEGW